MPTKQAHFPPGIKRAAIPPFSPAVSVGDQVYVSGQGPLDMATITIIGTTIEEQTELTLKNVEAALKAAGCTMADCVKVMVYLSDISHFDRYNAVYAKHFPEPRPARTTVEAKLWSGIMIEIDAFAIRGCGGQS